MPPRHSSVPRAIGRRPARFILRLVRLSALAAAAAVILIALDALLLPDEDPGDS